MSSSPAVPSANKRVLPERLTSGYSSVGGHCHTPARANSELAIISHHGWSHAAPSSTHRVPSSLQQHHCSDAVGNSVDFGGTSWDRWGWAVRGDPPCYPWSKRVHGNGNTVRMGTVYVIIEVGITTCEFLFVRVCHEVAPLCIVIISYSRIVSSQRTIKAPYESLESVNMLFHDSIGAHFWKKYGYAASPSLLSLPFLPCFLLFPLFNGHR